MHIEPFPFKRFWRTSTKLLLAFCAAILLILVPGCERFGDQGHQFAAKFWHERLTECSGSYFTWRQMPFGAQMELIQYSNPSVWVNADTLSDADRRNGLEWLGTTGLAASSWRDTVSETISSPYRDNHRIKFGQLGSWINGSPREGFRVWKQNGQWHVGSQDVFFGLRDNDPFGSSQMGIPRAVDCSVVPQE
jgi:hypothetical protein